MTNVKNIENSQYYRKVIEELKERCSERGEQFPFNVQQTRQKFKRCNNICRDAAMKIKTSSGIKHFQQDKERESWFGKLLAILSSMAFVNPNRLLNQEEKHLKLMLKKLILKKTMMIMFVKKRQVKALPQGPLMGHQMKKGNMYLHQRTN